MAAFKEWTRSEGLETSGSVEQFRNTRIAFDAEDYLNNLLTTTQTREPLLPALGGLPFALQKHVDDDLQSFRDAGIELMFVFGGLEPASKDKAMVLREARRAAKILEDAWSIYDQGRGDDAVVAFGKACTYKNYHILRWLHTHLHRSGVEVMTAPYQAAAQLVYLEQDRAVSAIAGSASCLVLGAEKVITNISWDRKIVSWVEATHCQGKTMLPPAAFNDLMLLSGCTGLLPAFVDVEHETPVLRIQTVRRLLAQANGDGHALCSQQQKDPDYLEAYKKAIYIIKHPVRMTFEGKIEPKDLDKAPNDIHEFTGQHLPAELYYYLTRGVAGSRVLNWQASNRIIETPPLDGGGSQAYKELISSKLNELRTRALAVPTPYLHRYFKNKAPVELVTWYSDEKRSISIKEINDPLHEASTWHVPDACLDTEALSRPLLAAMNMLGAEGFSEATVTRRAEGAAAPLSTPTEMIGNTVLRFLHDRGYINDDHTLSAWGKVLKAALDKAQANRYIELSNDTEAEEAIFMAMELLRLKILNAQHMFPTPPFSGQPLRGSETDKQHTLLISRIASLGLFRHRAIGYTGPLSRHLLAYHQMAAAVRQSLRDLLEMHACTLLMSGAVTRNADSKKELTDLGAAIPLGREPDLGLALVVKSYLDELSNEASKRADIKKWFNYVEDIDGDLEKAWKMWDAINAGVQAADGNLLASEKKTFKAADEWLHKKLAPTNGAA